jgi:transcriptional regulator with XRE-family HTH domain
VSTYLLKKFSYSVSYVSNYVTGVKIRYKQNPLLERRILMEIGNRLRDLRKDLGLTQKELASKVNVSPQVVSNWEREYSFPDYDDVVALSKVYNVSTDYLLGRTNDPSVSVDNVLTKLPEDLRKGILENIPKEELSESYIDGYLSGTITARYEICLIFTPSKDDILKLQKRLLAIALVSEVSEDTQTLEAFLDGDRLKQTLEKEHNLEFKVKLFKELNEYFLNIGTKSENGVISLQVNIEDEKYKKLLDANIIDPEAKEMTADKLVEMGLFLTNSIDDTGVEKDVDYEEMPIYLSFLDEAKRILGINNVKLLPLTEKLIISALMEAFIALESRVSEVLLKAMVKKTGTEEEWALEYLNKLSIIEKLDDAYYRFLDLDIKKQPYFSDLVTFIKELRPKIVHGTSPTEITKSMAVKMVNAVDLAINDINQVAKDEGIE